MSNPTSTVIWTGKHVKLVKHSGYTSYTMGSHQYTSGHVDLEYLSRQDGFSTRFHETCQSASEHDQTNWAKRGITWGRLTPAITAQLVERAQKVDAEVPAKRAAAKAAAEQKQAEEIEAAVQRKMAWNARVDKSSLLLHLIDKAINLSKNQDMVKLGELAVSGGAIETWRGTVLSYDQAEHWYLIQFDRRPDQPFNMFAERVTAIGLLDNLAEAACD